MRTISAILLLALTACTAPPEPERPAGDVTYVGSSTVAVFLRAAQPVYGAIDFQYDTAPESAGAESAILEGRADLAGKAGTPSAAVLGSAIEATLIGRDAIAVLVQADVGLEGLTREQLLGIFRGTTTNWSELGGPDLAIQPRIVGPESATHATFRQAVLGQLDYAGCEIVRPDATIVEAVATTPGAIGIISFSFLQDDPRIQTLAVDGHRPSVSNFEYPIARPLFLLWNRGDPVVGAFVDWARGREGQQVVQRDFVGVRVRGSVEGDEQAAASVGTLVVRTQTDQVFEGGILYYPLRPYRVETPTGDFVRRVVNSRGPNDETPARVPLRPGTYLVRTRVRGEGEIEFLVTIEAEQDTVVDVADFLEESP